MSETTESWFGREEAQKLHKSADVHARQQYLPQGWSANMDANDLISLLVPLACVPPAIHQYVCHWSMCARQYVCQNASVQVCATQFAIE